jgi:hypothetical protein
MGLPQQAANREGHSLKKITICYSIKYKTRRVFARQKTHDANTILTIGD